MTILATGAAGHLGKALVHPKEKAPERTPGPLFVRVAARS